MKTKWTVLIINGFMISVVISASGVGAVGIGGICCCRYPYGCCRSY
jgi:hypothetical protein